MQNHTQNGAAPLDHHLLEDQLDAIQEEVSKLIDRVNRAAPAPAPAPAPVPRLEALTRTMTDAIKAHPLAAVAAALGLGYLAVRIARR